MERRVVLHQRARLSRPPSTASSGIESQSIPRHRPRSRSTSSRTPTSAAAIAQIASVSLHRRAGSMPPGHAARRPSSSSTPRTCRSRRSPCRATPLRAAALRLRAQLHPRAALHHPRAVHARRRSAASSRQVMVDIDPGGAGGQGPVAARTWSARCCRRNVILPGRHRAHRRAPSTTSRSTPAPTTVAAVQRTSPSRWWAARPCCSATWRGCSDGFADQQNIVRVNGRRATYLAILKHADASTLAVVDAAREALLPASGPPRRRAWSSSSTSISRSSCAPPSQNVLREAIIASLLVSLMILFFLGSWRSAVHRLHLASRWPSSGGHRRPLAHRPHPQHHDPGRAGARHRHAGRRRHRRGGEHPPQPRTRASRSPWPSSTARSRSRCPRSRPRSPSASSSSRWCCSGAGALPLHPAGAVGGVRDARLLPALAHAGAGAGAPAHGDGGVARHEGNGSARASTAGATPASSGSRRATGDAGGGLAPPRASCSARSALVADLQRSRCPSWWGSTSSPASTRARCACTSARRSARASRRPSGWWRRPSSASGTSSRQASWRPSTTTIGMPALLQPRLRADRQRRRRRTPRS